MSENKHSLHRSLNALKVVISSNDSQLATRVALNFLNKSPIKKGVIKEEEEDDEDDIPLIYRVGQTPVKNTNRIPSRMNSPLRAEKRNTQSTVAATNGRAGQTPENSKTDRYSKPRHLTDNDISALLNESCSSSEDESDKGDSVEEARDVWTVTKKNLVDASPCDTDTDSQAGHSVQLTPKNNSVRRSLNLNSSKSPLNRKKQIVSPIKLRRKIQGVEVDCHSPKSGGIIQNNDDEGIQLRNRSNLKRPGWLDDDHEFETSPPKTHFSSPSTNRTRFSLRLRNSPRSLAASPAKSLLNSPKTPSLRRQVLEANTPVSSCKKKNLNNDFCTPLKTCDENLVITTPKSTPKHIQFHRDHEDDDDDDKDEAEVKNGRGSSRRGRPSVTPSKSSVKKRLSMTPAKSQIPSTPTSVKRVGHGFLTPVVAERGCKLLANTPNGGIGAEDEIDLARVQLHVSTVPSSLPCREKEFNNICNFITRKIQDRAGGCMYISGVPGTGKTATVHAVVRLLQTRAVEKCLPAFDFVEVNGLRLTEPRQAYVRILQGLQNEKVTADQAQRTLEKRFCGKPKKSTVLLVDELDYLCNRRQDVIYNILEWSCQYSSKLIVLTIANTMDLPERTLKGKVTSRMGLTRLVFQPYTYNQLQEIVMNRLAGSSTFHPDAVQLVARKVAAVSGDARRALDICRRSTELLIKDDEQVVTVIHVEKSLNQIFSGARVLAIRNCSLMWQYVLRAIRDETLRTGLEETNLNQVYNHLQAICSLEGKALPTVGEVLSICSSLSSCGLIVAEKGRTDLNKKLSLNVSSDDIHYALTS